MSAPVASLAHDVKVLAGRNLRVLAQSKTRGFRCAIVNPLLFFVGFYAVLHKLLTARGARRAVPPTRYRPAGDGVRRDLHRILHGRRPAKRDAEPLPHPADQPGLGGAGRLAADAVRALASILVVIFAGYVVGFRFEAGVAAGLGFVVLAVAFALSLAAGTAAIGLGSSQPEVVGAMMFLPFLPLLNLSTVFVPADRFPSWLQPVVKASPFSAVVEALRALASGGPTLTPLWHAAAWVVGLSVIFAWAATRAFRRAT